jgi:hypothetical protein
MAAAFHRTPPLSADSNPDDSNKESGESLLHSSLEVITDRSGTNVWRVESLSSAV